MAGSRRGAAAGRLHAAGFSGGGVVVVLDQAALARLLESEQGPVGKDILRRTLQVERKAKSLCPVDTGRLRASITSRMGHHGGELVGVVGTSVEYAPHVEFGHKVGKDGKKRVAAQPFLRPAIASGK